MYTTLAPIQWAVKQEPTLEDLQERYPQGSLWALNENTLPAYIQIVGITTNPFANDDTAGFWAECLVMGWDTFEQDYVWAGRVEYLPIVG